MKKLKRKRKKYKRN